MMALPAAAVSTSDSVMAPTPELRIFTPTFFVAAFSSAWLTASDEPWTSAFTTTLRVLPPPLFAFANRSSSVARLALPSSFWRAFSARWVATSFADFSSSTTLNSSPATGTPERPRTSTGYPGPTSSTSSPRSFIMARTRP